MEQLIAHLIGDYVLQSHWMAVNKQKRVGPALIHAMLYSVPFLFLNPRISSFYVIAYTHFVVDYWGLARYVVWAKNWIAPNRPSPLEDCPFGYDPEVPPWLACLLLIVADNTLHLACNYVALRWL